jgi:hypothetical protein
MSRRADRRRRKRSGQEETPSSERRFGLGRTEQIAIGFLVAGLVVVGVAALIISLATGGGDDTNAVANTTTSSAQATGTPGPTGSAQDQADIRALAQRSIEVLPAGQWPSLYDDFTADFKGRCDPAVFAQAGVDSATSLGAELQQLEFVDLKDLVVNATTATAVIVGGYKDLDASSDYDIEAAFAKEDGRWKIAPAPNTTGCSAFNQLH